MGKTVDIDKRTYLFALKVLTLVRKLPKDTAGLVLGRQLLRSGTSVAANVEEAQSAISKDDFAYKLSIALKEARESALWMRLINDGSVISDNSEVESIIREAVELQKILATIIKSAKIKPDNKDRI